jgi:hypothetical protein
MATRGHTQIFIVYQRKRAGFFFYIVETGVSNVWYRTDKLLLYTRKLLKEKRKKRDRQTRWPVLCVCADRLLATR